MQIQTQIAAKAGYALLAIEIVALLAGGGWFWFSRQQSRPEIRPAFEAIAFVGQAPITSILTTQHSAGRHVLSGSRDAMVGDSVDQWGDYSPVAGDSLLQAPEDPSLKPVVTGIRLTADRGELRALTFAPGVYMEAIGADETSFPLAPGQQADGLTVVQLVRCQVDTGKTLNTLELSNPKSGKKWLVLRAHADGSFESLLSPTGAALKVAGPAGAFVIVSMSWNPKLGQGTYRLGVRPVNGLPRQSKETKVAGKDLEALSQIRLGQKLEPGAAAGTMDVLETLVFNRDLGAPNVTKVEDWIHKHYFADQPVRVPFIWEAKNLTASWGDEASWSGEGIPAAREEVQFTKAPRPEPVTVTLDGNRQIKNLTFSGASPSWTLEEGSVSGIKLNITDGDTIGSEEIGAICRVNGTMANFKVAFGGFSGSATDSLTFQGDGGTVKFYKSLSRSNLGSSPDASRGMAYDIEAPNVIYTRMNVGFHLSPESAPVNGKVSTFVRVNQSQKTSADQIRIAGGGGSQFGVLTIQNKATWSQEKGAIYVGYSGSNGTSGRSNGRLEIGHTNSTGYLVISKDANLRVGDIGGTGVIDVNNGTLTIMAASDTMTVMIGSCGSDRASGGGNGTINLNTGGTIVTERNFTRTPLAVTSGAAKFNFNGGLLRINRGTGNLTKDLIGSGITVLLNATGARIDTNGHQTVLSRDLLGPGGLEKLGNGTLTLSGRNSYKGTTKVAAGVLAVSGQALPSSGTLELKGGKVHLANPASVAKLLFSGAPQASGTWGATGSGAAHIDDSRFTGPGILNVP